MCMMALLAHFLTDRMESGCIQLMVGAKEDFGGLLHAFVCVCGVYLDGVGAAFRRVLALLSTQIPSQINGNVKAAVSQGVCREEWLKMSLEMDVVGG